MLSSLFQLALMRHAILNVITARLMSIIFIPHCFLSMFERLLERRVGEARRDVVQ
jgi:hypothetical protein